MLNEVSDEVPDHNLLGQHPLMVLLLDVLNHSNVSFDLLLELLLVLRLELLAFKHVLQLLLLIDQVMMLDIILLFDCLGAVLGHVFRVKSLKLQIIHLLERAREFIQVLRMQRLRLCTRFWGAIFYLVTH